MGQEEDGARLDRIEKRRGREGYMQVLSELWRSSRYINSFISAADSAGFLGHGKPRLVSRRSPDGECSFRGDSRISGERTVLGKRRGNEPFDRENIHLVFMNTYGEVSQRKLRRRYGEGVLSRDEG